MVFTKFRDDSRRTFSNGVGLNIIFDNEQIALVGSNHLGLADQMCNTDQLFLIQQDNVLYCTYWVTIERFVVLLHNYIMYTCNTHDA